MQDTETIEAVVAVPSIRESVARKLTGDYVHDVDIILDAMNASPTKDENEGLKHALRFMAENQESYLMPISLENTVSYEQREKDRLWDMSKAPTETAETVAKKDLIECERHVDAEPRGAVLDYINRKIAYLEGKRDKLEGQFADFESIARPFAEFTYRIKKFLKFKELYKGGIIKRGSVR
jgi:hypothetical protein